MPILLTDARKNQTSIQSYQCSGLFPQQVIKPYQDAATQAETTSYSYDCGSGKLLSATDPNGATTMYTYSDPLERLTLIQRASGTDEETQTVFSYPTMTQVNTSQDKSTKGDSILQSSIVSDGLGRTVHATAPSGAMVDTSYDALGRIKTVSNPHFTTGLSSNGTTGFSYDALGRKLLQCQPDNGFTSPCTAGASYLQWIYSGNSVASYDEKRNYWSGTTDALGRVTKVLEPDGSQTAGVAPVLETDYVYNSLDNLSKVAQQGKTGDTARSRSYTYDSLSRLLCASNPENSQNVCPADGSTSLPNGVISYTYDLNGNVGSKTDARGVVTSYSYDAVNRLTSKSYSDGTPAAAVGYDGKDENGAALTTPSLNSIGRLSRSVNANLGSNYSYDEMGRVKQQSYCFFNCAQPVSVGAGYDLAGNMTSLTYPDGRTVGQNFDGAGRMSAVNYTGWSNNPHTSAYLTATSPGGYDPAGHLVSATLGNVAAMAAGYDNRERVSYLAYGTPAQLLWGKQYGWMPNSNLQTMTDAFTGVQRQFGYDNLNRLTSGQDIVGSASQASDPIFQTFSAGTGSPTGTPTGSTSSSGAAPFWTDPNDSNVLTNPDIPVTDGRWNAGWYADNDGVTAPGVLAPDGTMSASNMVANSSGTDFWVDDTVAQPYPYSGTTMTASVWLRAPNGAQDVYISLFDRGSGPWSGTTKLAHVTTAWQQFQLSRVTQRLLGDLSFQIGGGGTISNGQVISFWNPMVEDSGTAGQTVTNLLPYSQRLGGSSWDIVSGGVGALDLSAVAPDGTVTASTVNAIDDSFFITTVPTPTPMSGVPATGSIWLRSPGTSQTILLTLAEAGSDGSSTTLNTAMVGLTNDWQRFQLTGTTQDTTKRLTLQVGGSNTFTAGQSLLTWGAQIELAPSEGPYVATGGRATSVGTNLTNILPFSQQPNAPSWGGTTNFTGVVNAVAAPDGSQTGYEATAGGGTGSIVDDVANPALYDGDTLTASVYLRSPNAGSVNVYLNSAVNTANPQSRTITQTAVQLTSTWRRVVLTGLAPNALARLYLQIGDSNPTGQKIDLWGAQMELSPTAGPYVATSALAVVTGQETTNLLPYSQQLSGPYWSVAQGSATPNSATAPDGTTTAATLTGNGSTTGIGTSVINAVPNPSYYDNQTMTASVFLKGPSGSSRNMYIYLMSQDDTGQSNTLASTNISVTDIWQRYTVTGMTGNGLTKLYLQIGDQGCIFTTGQSMYVWGPQLVVGTVAAPYMPTTTTTPSPVTGQPATLVANGLNQTYSYDSFGNLLQNGSFNNVYTANNQLFGYSYDAAGNMLSTGSAYNLVSMTYDAENRISTANGAVYVYDAEGNRVQKQGVTLTETIYFGGRPIARVDGGGETDLIYGPTGLLAEVAGNESADPVFHLTDHLGTQVGSVNSSGILTNPLDYTPWGQIFSGSTNDPYFFTGKERDAESGNDYFGARYYGSSMGRFMSPDPIKITEDRVANPNTLNLYSYAANNPLKYVDPDGQDITYFYDQGGIAGHAVIFAYNQQTGDGAIESFGPIVHSPMAAGQSMFDLGPATTPDQLRQTFAALTIQTSPELAQQVIDYIRANPDPSNWMAFGPNCSTQCSKILQKFKLEMSRNKGRRPKVLWNALRQQYNPNAPEKPTGGLDYGAPRRDMFGAFWNQIQQNFRDDPIEGTPKKNTAPPCLKSRDTGNCV